MWSSFPIENDSEAVSSVVGVVLVVGFTVALSVAVGVFVLDLGTNQSADYSGLDGVTISEEDDGVYVSIVTDNEQPIEVLDDGEAVHTFEKNSVGGEIRLGNVSPDSEIVARSVGNNSQQVLSTHTADKSTSGESVTVLSEGSSVIILNSPPTADFVTDTTRVNVSESVSFDASGSSDSDGNISSYAWDFGDSSTGAGVSPSHAYSDGGKYTVTLTVTDNEGDSKNVSQEIEVNSPPTAIFSNGGELVDASESVTFDASGSSDVEGNISSYAWDFGDSSIGTGVSPSHAYSAGGKYNVTLTVTDNEGESRTVSQEIEVNSLPSAVFSAGKTLVETSESVTFDASGSSDDGTITSYAWDFGDSTTGAGVSPSHTYSNSGEYTVNLVVTDDNGATENVSQTIEVNAPPTAVFSDGGGIVKSSESVTFDASGSSDTDGAIDSYSWDFGDSTTGSGVSPSHTYSSEGDYTVTLTVTDNEGATKTTSQTVEVERLIPIKLTQNRYDNNHNGESACSGEYGSDWIMADWSHVESSYNSKPLETRRVFDATPDSGGRTIARMTYGESQYYYSDRAYWASHEPDRYVDNSGALIHDGTGSGHNQRIWVGSWYGTHYVACYDSS